MFQYTHEVIFNSLTMPDGSKRLVRNEGQGPLIIKRGGEYWKAFIQDNKVYKTVGNEGEYELLTLNVETLGTIFPGQDSAFMNPGVYQLNLFVKLLDPHALYEFGYPYYNTFGRHILVGFEVEAGDVAADVAAKIYESLALAVNKEEILVGGLDTSGETPIVTNFEENATVIAMRANHYALRFDTVGIAMYDETTCDSCIGEYLPTIDILNNKNPEKNAAVITTEGVEPFATGQWLIENLRFPTYPNIRWAAVGDADRPIPGMVYVQYSFAYDSPRPQFGGLSGVGQKVEAVTRHIYYIPVDLAEEFEQALSDLGVDVVETYAEITDPDGNTVSGGSNTSEQEGEQETTPTYALLSEAPNDWNENYTNYFTKDGDNYVAVPAGEGAPVFAENTYYRLVTE